MPEIVTRRDVTPRQTARECSLWSLMTRPVTYKSYPALTCRATGCYVPVRQAQGKLYGTVSVAVLNPLAQPERISPPPLERGWVMFFFDLRRDGTFTNSI